MCTPPFLKKDGSELFNDDFHCSLLKEVGMISGALEKILDIIWYVLAALILIGICSCMIFLIIWGLKCFASFLGIE